ncbi:MAG TPA: winged helix-turn-helix domain-containing protein [Caulobacteraceae bacterium]|nr:winged helix-turn-helix domain-containing protein [Caulobacteraceae bacterium]
MRLFADQSPMMEAEAVRRPSGSIHLAQEADFRLGQLLVRPSLREVIGQGRREILEPRVMQVLVTLAGMKGFVVSRDELIDTCWGGRVVGEDAINRTIGRLRRLAETFAGAFEIETVARVGYRLSEIETPPTPAPVKRGPDRGVRIAVYAAVAGLLAAHAVAAVLVWRQIAPVHWSVASSRLLVSNDSIERHPAISPDGKTIAYAGGSDVFTRQIYLRSLAGGDPVRLTDEPGDHTAITWSPDGRSLAYAVFTPGQPCTLMVRPLHDGPARTLGRCQTDARTEVAWSRTGEALYFVDRPNAQASERIVQLDLASGRRSDLTHPPAGSLGDASIGLSPDGRWMSFNRSPNDVVETVMVRNLKTGEERALNSLSAWMEPGGWTSDSRAVLLAGRVNGDNVLWAYPLSGGAPVHVMSGPLVMGRVVTGPGDIAAVEVNTESFTLASPPTAKGGDPRFLDNADVMDSTPAFARDGTLAIAGERAGESAVWIKRPGMDFQRLVSIHSSEEPEGLSFSPDGTAVVFASEVSGGPGIRIIGLNGQQLGNLRFPGSDVSAPVWAADGRSVIFAGRDAGGWRLWRLGTAPFGQLTPASGYGWLNVQASGGALYGVRAGAAGVWRIDGEPKRISALPLSAFPTLWRIDGDAIEYVDNVAGRTPRIMRQPIAGGPAKLIAEVPSYDVDHGFAVDPRSGDIVYLASRTDRTDLQILHLARG